MKTEQTTTVTTTTPAPQKGGKAARAAKRKARYQSYLMRATCMTCKAVFRSPKKKAAHAASGHKSMLGVNLRRVAKAQ